MKTLTLMLLILITLLGNAQTSDNNKLMVIEYLDNLTRLNPDIIWYLDEEGNIYDYNPTIENDSIIKENQKYQIKLDSLNNKQFQELDNWYKTYKQ